MEGKCEDLVARFEQNKNTPIGDGFSMDDASNADQLFVVLTSEFKFVFQLLPERVPI